MDGSNLTQAVRLIATEGNLALYWTYSDGRAEYRLTEELENEEVEIASSENLARLFGMNSYDFASEIGNWMPEAFDLPYEAVDLAPSGPGKADEKELEKRARQREAFAPLRGRHRMQAENYFGVISTEGDMRLVIASNGKTYQLQRKQRFGWFHVEYKGALTPLLKSMPESMAVRVERRELPERARDLGRPWQEEVRAATARYHALNPTKSVYEGQIVRDGPWRLIEIKGAYQLQHLRSEGAGWRTKLKFANGEEARAVTRSLEPQDGVGDNFVIAPEDQGRIPRGPYSVIRSDALHDAIEKL